jgi:hypothetical protein
MSEIEWRRLRNRTAREIVSALNRDGFVPSITNAAPINATAMPTAAKSPSHSTVPATPFRSERFAR